MRTLLPHPVGCDTFVAFPPTAPPNHVIFGKNSDRPAGEGQSIRRYLAQTFAENNNNLPVLECTYTSIPQAPQTHAVLLSQIDWMWGAEMGANDCGVVIGNEAVWTKEPDEGEGSLLGMDLVRLGLERGDTARIALETMTHLLETHGQGGACAENDASFTYHNSFLIVDSNEAWVLETAGRHWAAEKITSGSRNISNGLTIRTKMDLCSPNLKEHARKQGFWDGTCEFDFAKCFSAGTVEHPSDSRQVCGAKLLSAHDMKGDLDYQAMIKILRNHESGICMHGGFETTASMVSELRQGSKEARHWLTGKPHPCKSEFLLQDGL